MNRRLKALGANGRYRNVNDAVFEMNEQSAKHLLRELVARIEDADTRIAGTVSAAQQRSIRSECYDELRELFIIAARPTPRAANDGETRDFLVTAYAEHYTHVKAPTADAAIDVARKEGHWRPTMNQPLQAFTAQPAPNGVTEAEDQAVAMQG